MAALWPCTVDYKVLLFGTGGPTRGRHDELEIGHLQGPAHDIPMPPMTVQW
jgi:hypothetical protein